jgi:hypothetical protein
MRTYYRQLIALFNQKFYFISGISCYVVLILIYNVYEGRDTIMFILENASSEVYYAIQ